MTNLQKTELEILRAFVDICDRLHLRYYLVCGSALGAVKYGGFIPWDDDIDVALRREEYEIFCREAPSLLPKEYFLQTHKTDPAYPWISAKIRDSRTAYIEQASAHLDIHHGVFIDVFPLDGYPVEKRKISALERRKTIYKLLLLSAYRGNYSRKVQLLMQVLRLAGIPRKTAEISERCQRIFAAYPTETSPLLCNHGNWQGKLEYARREQYGEGILMSFEGLPVRVPELFDEYLTQKYGNWRGDPPPREQIGHHYYTVMDLNRPYTDYLKNTGTIRKKEQP